MTLDPVALSAAAIAVVSPYLTTLGEAATEEFGKRVPEYAGNIYRWLKDKFSVHPVAAAALINFETRPEDERSQAILRLALEQVLKGDIPLQSSLFALLPPDFRATVGQTGFANSGSAITQIAGSGNSSSVSVAKT